MGYPCFVRSAPPRRGCARFSARAHVDNDHKSITTYVTGSRRCRLLGGGVGDRRTTSRMAPPAPLGPAIVVRLETTLTPMIRGQRSNGDDQRGTGVARATRPVRAV